MEQTFSNPDHSQIFRELTRENQLMVVSPFLSGEAPLVAVALNSQLITAQRLEIANGIYHMTYPTAIGEIDLSILITQSDRDIEWSVIASGPDLECSVYFPFLEQVCIDNATRTIDFYALENRQEKPVLNRRNFQAPFVFTNEIQSLVLLQKGELIEKEYSSTRLTNLPGLPVKISVTPREIYHAKLSLVQGGWRTAFEYIRQNLREELNLEEYAREDLQWYSDQFVQHFTFLYGREILDLENGKFNLERFLEEAERDFGGYDGFLIWVVYQRVGIDERTQWDYYDDVPGGREGLRQMSGLARQRGVRFFVPYKPWDRSNELHGRQVPAHEEELARLIVDTEADGVFLDTMDMITPAFRQEIDRRKSGVVFCSEGRTRGPALEIVTGCWEQSPNRGQGDGNWSASTEIMPVIDLWRFVLPEHRLFVINRHAMGDDRLRIIQRGFFNGMGWVVWQDIFGLTLPYTSEEAALLKKCRTIFRENRLAVNSPSPTPYIPTLIGGVWANEFPGDQKRMWTFYNENEESIAGEVIAIEPRQGCHFVDVWNSIEVPQVTNGMVHLEIAAKSVSCLVEFPCLLEISPNGRQVRFNNVDETSQVHLEMTGNANILEMSPGIWSDLPVRQGWQTIKLIRDREVLDQICFREAA